MKQSISYILKTLGKVTAIIAVVLFSACSDDYTPAEPQEPSNDQSIKWDIETTDGTRALVTYASMKADCTPKGEIDSPGDDSERVAVWADLVYKSDKRTVEYFNDVELAFYKKSGRKGKNWNYPGEDKYWVSGTNMLTRAYYPAKYFKDNHKIELSSNATSFRLKYSTYEEQKDLMLGFRNIDSDVADRSIPIDIKMRHGLAAVKFQFKLTDRNFTPSNKLTSFWLETAGENTDTTRFGTVGTLIYGMKNIGKTVLEDSIMWKKTFFPESGKAFYKWQNDEGIEFTKTTPGVPFLNNDGANKTLYSDNEGYILIIPQYVPKQLFICFTTENGGKDNITKVAVPYDRGASDARDIFSKETDPNNDNYYIMEDGHRKQFYKPNTRYTYNILIDQSAVMVTVDVAPWNNYDSNTNIDF